MNTHDKAEQERKLNKAGINIRTWPHQFTKTGNKDQIGEDRGFMPDGEHAMKIYSEEYICVHCHKTYWSRKDSIPSPPCPARKMDKEMKRILG